MERLAVEHLKTADAVVIGGGINGCTTAYTLRKLGVARVVLVEKGHIASGPTGLSSGIVRQHYSHKTLAAMARDSVKVWRRFADEVGGDAGFVPCGVVFFAGEREADAMRAAVAEHRAMGIDERPLSASELRALEPMLRADDIAVGAYDVQGGYADPALAANSYAAAAERLGVEILRNTEVTAFSIERGRLGGVRTTAGDIATDRCAIVAGPWGGRVARLAGVDLPITASRHAVLMFERAPSWKGSTPVWGDLVRGWYYKPDGPRQIMVGSLRDLEGGVSIEDYAKTPSGAERETYAAAILDRFPVMEDGSPAGGWAALYDVTPDWQPIIDVIEEVAGLCCAVGFSGAGFKIGPAVGAVVAELVMDGRCTSYDIGLFRRDRFREASSSRGAYEYGIIG